METRNPEKKLDRQSLDNIFKNQNSDINEKILDLVSSKYGKELSSDAGVREKYTIKQHTSMVLLQFDKYYQSSELPMQISPELFKIVLTLHDIGKAEAIRLGDKHKQHEITLPILTNTLKELGFQKKEIDIAEALVQDDCIGKAIRGKEETITQEVANEIKEIARSKNLPPKELLDLMLILYKVDAGSYTTDAGGQPSLNYLFKFNKENGKIDLTDAPQKRINALYQLI